MKNVLLYLALFILVILLLLPPGLRLFGKDLYNEPKFVKPKDILEILSCTKINESISSTFMNGKPLNIKYEINGNFVPEETNDEKENQDINPDEVDNEEKNQIIEGLKKYADIKYDEAKNSTKFQIGLDSFDTVPEEMQIFNKSINEMNAYYSELSFSCTTQRIEN